MKITIFFLNYKKKKKKKMARKIHQDKIKFESIRFSLFYIQKLPWILNRITKFFSLETGAFADSDSERKVVFVLSENFLQFQLQYGIKYWIRLKDAFSKERTIWSLLLSVTRISFLTFTAFILFFY